MSHYGCGNINNISISISGICINHCRGDRYTGRGGLTYNKSIYSLRPETCLQGDICSMRNVCKRQLNMEKNQPAGAKSGSHCPDARIPLRLIFVSEMVYS